MKTIFYNTTRQWNCGDEFILLGVKRVLDEVYGKHNPIIFNRNPDIRPANGIDVFYRNEKLPINYDELTDVQKNGALYRYGFHDNSVKFDTDLSYVDLAVFAGTPEWCNDRCINFYEHIINNKLPCIILGVGSIPQEIPEYMEEVISNSLLWTVRDKKYLDFPLCQKYSAKYITCPALLSAPYDAEKIIHNVKNIGLVFGANFEHSVRCNCIDDKTYNFHINLYEEMIKKYQQYKFSIICHYIDELSIAHRIFDKYNIDILYSYDAKDYIDIYHHFDFVISPRVHGCGISSSMGIPNINITHDDRGSTCKGFLSEIITNETPLNDVFELFENIVSEISNKNQEIINHKNNIFKEYVNLVRERAFYLQQIKYKNVSFPQKTYLSLTKNKQAISKPTFYELKICKLFSHIMLGKFKCKYKKIYEDAKKRKLS